MAIFKYECPYCGTRDVAFQIASYEPVNKGHAQGRNVTDYDALCKCGYCLQCVVARISCDDPFQPNVYSPVHHAFRLINVRPNPTWVRVPDHLPANIEKFFRQGLDGLRANHDAAGAMFRKALDVGLKEKFPAITGTLFERINKAVAQGSLTKDLGDWANHIRLEGNNAVHDDDPYTEKEAQDLHVFADLVMRYLFTLPGMLDERRKNKGKAATAK